MSSGVLTMTVRAAAARTPAAVSTLLLAAVCAVGVAAYLYPFLLADAPETNVNPRAGDAPLLF
ncbi:MAG: hypothetical protein IIB87_06395, partial [Chloroflexi bacterium]|nr:hypothetical protein [Chloroflexota bacterium]